MLSQEQRIVFLFHLKVLLIWTPHAGAKIIENEGAFQTLFMNSIQVLTEKKHTKML